MLFFFLNNNKRPIRACFAWPSIRTSDYPFTPWKWCTIIVAKRRTRCLLICIWSPIRPTHAWQEVSLFSLNSSSSFFNDLSMIYLQQKIAKINPCWSRMSLYYVLFIRNLILKIKIKCIQVESLALAKRRTPKKSFNTLPLWLLWMRPRKHKRPR